MDQFEYRVPSPQEPQKPPQDHVREWLEAVRYFAGILAALAILALLVGLCSGMAYEVPSVAYGLLWALVGLLPIWAVTTLICWVRYGFDR